MAELLRIQDVMSVKVEGDRPRYYKVGTIHHYSDGVVKLRLNFIPDQEYRLFDKEVRKNEPSGRGGR